MSTQILTDSDLQGIHSLDFAPTCEHGEIRDFGVHKVPCESPAAWAVHTRSGCGCPCLRLLCAGHLPEYLEFLRPDDHYWACRNGCGSSLPAPTVLRIEAL